MVPRVPDLSRRQKLTGRALWFAERCGMDDAERHELAMMLPDRHEATPWRHLTDAELATLCAWLRGAVLVAELQSLRCRA